MYSRFYGFAEKPFHVTPNPKFLYFAESHQKAIDALLYGIGERKGFISISGEAGTGKTTLLHHLLNILEPNIKTVFISQTRMTPKQLLKEILHRLHLNPKDQSKISLIRELNEYLVSALTQEGNLAILIDEAQSLSLEVLEELRMLSNLETTTSKLIQIVFVGQPELEDKLNSRELRQLKQRIAIRSQLRPLSEEESREYIHHRLRLVNRTASEIFSPEAIELICRHAGGIPRAINLLCDNVLLVGFRRREKRIPAATVKEVLSDRGMVLEDHADPAQPAAISKRRFPETITRKRFFASVGYGFAGILAVLFLIGAAIGYLSFSDKRIKYSLGGAEVAAGIDRTFTEKVEPGGMPEPEKTLPNPQEQKDDRNPASQKDEIPLGTAMRVDQNTPGTKIVSVGEGDTLYSILRMNYRHANTTLLDYLLELNPEIVDPNQVEVNDRIRVPVLDEEILIHASANGKFRIHLATFTKKIDAEKFKQGEMLRGQAVEIENRSVSSREIWYRLFIGEYDSKEESRKALNLLRKKGLLPFFLPVS